MKRFFISDHHFFNYNVNTYCDRPYIHNVVDNKVYFNNVLISEENDNQSAIYKARGLTVSVMNEDMIKKWNETVAPDDEVYYGGDFAFPCDMDKGKELLERLNGIKYLILGNHDGNAKKMIEMGFKTADHSKYLELKNGRKIVLSHYQYIDPVFSNVMRIMKNSGKEFLSVPQYSKSKGEVQDQLFNTMNDIMNKMENPFVDLKKNVGYFQSLLKLNLNPNNQDHVSLINKRKQMFSYFIGTKLINDGTILVHGHTHSKTKRFLNQINICAEAWGFIPVSEDQLIEQIDDYDNEIKSILIIEDSENYSKYDKEIRYIEEIRFIDSFQKIKGYLHILRCVLEKVKISSSTTLPKFDETWYNLAVKHKLLIDKNDLDVGSIYQGDCRNAEYAYWDGVKFTYLRSKFGSEFLEEINHPIDDDGFDVFIPQNKVVAVNDQVLSLIQALGFSVTDIFPDNNKIE